MGKRMNNTVDGNEMPCKPVDRYMLVQRKEVIKSLLPKLGDREA